MRTKFLKEILNFLFPENFTCNLCGKEVFNGERFCVDCQSKIVYNNGTTCPVCGRRTKTPTLCLECKEYAPLYKKAVSPLVYEKGVIALIHAFKNDKPYLKNYFAEIMARECEKLPKADIICYTPMLKRDERKRGYNQAKLLAKELSELLSIPVCKNAIIKIKKTSAQKSLSRRDRAENLKGCFKADKKSVNGKKVLLVDDVLTTGATADALCAQLLKRGAAEVYFVTAASVEYHSDNKQE